MECRLENIAVHYEQFGEGRAVVLLHGWPIDHRHMVKDFEPLFEQRDGWKRIYPDMPGMGKTPGANWITNLDQMLDVLLEFLDAVIPGERFAVGGTSYGGYLAQGLIYRRSDEIDGACFMTPYMGVSQENSNLPTHVTLVEDESVLSELQAGEAEFFRGFAVVQSRELLESIRTDVVPAFEIADHEFLAKIEEHVQFSFDVHLLPKPFVKPVLFLLGRQDSVVGYADIWNVLDSYPRASYVVLDRAGHGMGVEQKGLFLALTQEWLDRVEESTR
jgi:pimeloyl-ACP methyl ester carboxylesterase